MSTEWGYFCKTCQEESETWFNHGSDILEQYIQARNLTKDLYYIDIAPTGNKWAVSEMDTFLDAHEGHEICAISEYGKMNTIKN